MLNLIKKRLATYPNLKAFIQSPSNWLYCAYLTLRYVDEYKNFPAFQIKGSIKLKISKAKSAKIIIGEKLIFEQWLYGGEFISLCFSKKSSFIVEKEFVIGNGVRVYLAPFANLLLKGKHFESASGITANSVLMVKEYLEIGYDCIIAWDNFITDCDWHDIDGKRNTTPTVLGDHVWIGVGCKILKGALIKKNSIVTASSVVLSGTYDERSLISGAPSKIKKSNISDWHRDMSS